LTELFSLLRVKVIPTLALIKDAKTRDFVVGFTDLGENNCLSKVS
jgi:hypothetical protein